MPERRHLQVVPNPGEEFESLGTTARRETMHLAAVEVCFALVGLESVGVQCDPARYYPAKAELDRAYAIWKQIATAQAGWGERRA